MDQDALSPTQRTALGQLQALTNGGDPEVAVGVLESVDWDVQRAADVVFGSAPSAPLSINKSPSTNGAATAPEETFDVDDSEQNGLLSGRPSGREFARVTPTISVLSILMRPLRLILALLAVPYTILRTILRTLRIPLPLPPVPLAFSLAGLGLNLGLSGAGRRQGAGGPAPVRDAKTAAERWVRALEEETGCVCVSRAQAPYGEASGSAASGAGSSATNRRPAEEHAQRLLPDFFIGSYEAFARQCAKESEPRIGCVVLVSEEHDDVAEFKRSTLTDPEFVQLTRDLLVWGGDIRDRDAWSAAQKLQATTYPFVAFLALQPRRGASSAGQKAALTVLSRHQGPAIPLSGGAPTSPRTLCTHIAEQLRPRVAPALERIRDQAAQREAARAYEAREREAAREIRAAQDRAFEESARRDRERIERRMREEREAEEAERRRSVEEARAQEEAAAREVERRAREERRMGWRRWARRALLPREPRPGEHARGRTVRVGVRMPDGRRAVRFFGEADAVTAVFVFVDALFIPEGPAYAKETDPTSPPESEGTEGAGAGEAALAGVIAREAGEGGAERWWGFRLATVYPRKEIAWAAGRTVGEVDGLRHGGQLVVELVDAEGKGKGRARESLDGDGSASVSAGAGGSGNDSDEYETESD
ncbi:hypothetical protein EIP86_006634 [Pleurotus ostreatoroseus]|nr:hypothetical protein EIP86_006634 [Pleurotus ostreatoroseus]